MEVTVVDHGGGIADAAGLACLAALMAHRRPSVTKHNQTLKIESPLVRLQCSWWRVGKGTYSCGVAGYDLGIIQGLEYLECLD